MLDFPSVLWIKLPVVDTIHPQNNKFAMSGEHKATGASALQHLYCLVDVGYLIL